MYEPKFEINHDALNFDSIEIKKSPSADSRSAKEPLTPEVLNNSTRQHIADVNHAMLFICDKLLKKADAHDHTKLENMEDFCDALNSGHVKDSPWYQKHITEERHHLKSNVPDDVNLLDVMEHVVDCTMAGLARSGDVYDTDLSPDMLVLAVNNTVELLKQNTRVLEDNSESDVNDQEIEEE